MSDIRIYTAANMPDSPLTGDVVICSEAFNSAPANSVHLATVGGSNPTWKSFQNDSAAAPVFAGNSYSMSFDGVDAYLDGGASMDFDLVSGGTLSFWINPIFTEAPSYMEPFSKRSTAGWQITQAKSGTSYNILLYNHTFSGGYPLVNLPTENEWYLINVVFHAAGGITIHRNDGASGSSGTGATSYKSGYSVTEDSSASLFVGKHATSTSRYFKGNLDEVAIFQGTELTDTQVEDIYNSGVPKDIDSYDPTCWWRMGENDYGAGTTVSNVGNSDETLSFGNSPSFSNSVPS